MHKIKNAKTTIFMINANPFMSSAKVRMEVVSKVAPILFTKSAKILLDGIPYSRGFSIYVPNSDLGKKDDMLFHYIRGLERMDYYVTLRFLSSLSIFVSDMLIVARAGKEGFNSFVSDMKNRPIYKVNEWFIGKTMHTFNELVSKRILLDQFFWCITRLKEWMKGRNINPIYPLVTLFTTSIDEHVMLENLYISSPSINPDSRLVDKLNEIESKMKEYDALLKKGAYACFRYTRPFKEVSEVLRAAKVLANVFSSIVCVSESWLDAITTLYLEELNENNRLTYLLEKIEEEYAFFEKNDAEKEWHAFTIILSVPYPLAFVDKIRDIILADKIVHISLNNESRGDRKGKIILPPHNTLH